MGPIFLSYSRRDEDLMHRVRDSLRADGLEVWTDENLAPGTRSWKSAIESALENASCLVVILSPDSKKSAWVREEMNYAEAQNIRIFPLLARGEAKTAVPFGFITAQWVDIRQENDFVSGMQKLAFTVRVHLGMVSQEPRVVQPASIDLRPDEHIVVDDKTQPRPKGAQFPAECAYSPAGAASCEYRAAAR
ncbi:MAG TPA: toll/interleukin-1 receptor domain-containing protein, partial [Phototrophicaceae bacterium]|nr:toll/interleukin-1 receptor domain-containing protein [Phototrophicaceae bacterium]